MLIRFGASNYASIAEYQEISLVASSLTDPESDLIAIEGLKDKLLPSALIYGANAAGKTNIIQSLFAMAKAVKYSHSQSKPKSLIPRKPFAFSKDADKSLTQHDCDFIIDDVRYHYGFKYNDREFIEEWLYAFPHGTRQTWFYRESGRPIAFGKYLKGRNRSIEEFVRPNSLFLSTAAQNAHTQLTPIYSFFDNSIQFDMVPSANEFYINSLLSDETPDGRLVSFLRLADTGILDISFEEKTKPEKADEFIKGLESLFQAHMPNSSDTTFKIDQDVNLRIASLEHNTGSGSTMPLPLSDESRGTLRLIELISPALKALDEGSALVIDEIDASLHTSIAKSVMKLFSSSETNKKGAQLIATTHDTNLLCAEVVRRDQVWFAEKSPEGKTWIYPLTDIKTRKTDNLEKGYIEGRFGAVPLIGDVKAIFERDNSARG